VRAPLESVILSAAKDPIAAQISHAAQRHFNQQSIMFEAVDVGQRPGNSFGAFQEIRYTGLPSKITSNVQP
jgi:hypothetical protein